MPPENRTPNVIAEVVYKITTAAEWMAASARGRFIGSSDDLRDGYIHLSAKSQVHGTLAKYFSAQTGLVLVAFEADALGPRLRWEKSRGGELFPHFYGELPTQNCLWARALKQGADKAFDLNEDFFRC